MGHLEITSVSGSDVKETESTDHLVSNNKSYDELTKDINVISYANNIVTIGNDVAQYVPPPAQNNEMILSVIEQMQHSLYKEVHEMKSIFKQMEDEVDQCSVEKKYFKIEKKQLLINNDRLLEDNISGDIMCTYLRNKLYSVTPLPKTQFIPKVVKKNDLSKTITSHLHTNKIIEKCTKVLAPCLLKIEAEPINAYFKNNRVVHRDYLKVTKEHVETLHELLEQARALKPLDENLVFACKFAERIRELLVKRFRWKPIGRMLNMEGSIRPIIQTTPATIMPSCNSLHTIRIPAVAPNADIRMRHSIAKNSLIRAHINSYGHPFNNLNFAFIRNFVISKQPSWNFGFIVKFVLWYLDFGCSEHMTGQRDKLISFISMFIGMVRFDNDHFAAIMGSGDLQLRNILITRVYYVEGLGHNLFSVGQLWSRGSNLYTISLNDMMKSSPICLISKASKTKSWLWHRRLSHLNFGTINQLAKQGLVKGLPKLKCTKDHPCSTCQMGTSKKEWHKPKPEPSINEKLQMLHMDFCRPMQVENINRKRYVLVIVDDHSQFTWVKFLRTKDKAPEIIIKAYTKDVGITHHTFIARSSQQNGVVERRNHTLVEVARTMFIFSKSSLFLWAEAVAAACYTQNRSLIYTRYNKTPYELLRDRKLDLKHLHVFGALCYPTYDRTDLGKLKPKANIGIFIGYSPYKKGLQNLQQKNQINNGNNSRTV
ncbi:retrovirus-related pol polyprotein from transposon TNT 1-94 [Tanacetum coccineum]